MNQLSSSLLFANRRKDESWQIEWEWFLAMQAKRGLLVAKLTHNKEGKITNHSLMVSYANRMLLLVEKYDNQYGGSYLSRARRAKAEKIIRISV